MNAFKLNRWYTVTGLLLLAAVASIALVAPSTTNTSAISGADFKPGNIIGNAAFYDKDAMNPGEIQAFLNAKIPNCTSGYTCLNEYRQDTPQRHDSSGLCATYPAGDKVAAQIIYDVAQVCGVSPKMMLVLLQKEQGLVTSTAPSSIQYRSATGYGCPDTAACSSEYYGFFNQVYKAAWQYKYYAQYPDSYSYRAGRANAVLWNPNANCGSSDVFIENQATAGLYIYTPYRPNQAALNNLYGTGDGCSSYGNRNFWRTFSDWFGINNKALIRTESSSTLYYTDGKYKYSIPSMNVVSEYGLGLNDVGFVSQSSLNSIPNSPLSSSLNYIVKSDSDSDADGGDIYLITNGKRFRVTSMEQMTKFNLDPENLTYLPYYALVRMPHGGNLSEFVHGPDGFVFRVIEGKKSGIFQPAVYSSLNPSKSASMLSPFALSRLATTTPIISGYIGLKSGDGKIWIASSTNWSYVPSMNIADCVGLKKSVGLVSFTPSQAVAGPAAEAASCFVSDGNGNEYILDGTKKYVIKDAWGLVTKPVLAPSMLTDKLTVQTEDLSIFKNPTNSALYTLDQGFKRHITNMEILGEINQTEQDIQSLGSGLLSILPNGHGWFASGTVLQNTTTGQLYVMNNDSKTYISGMDVFRQFGYKTSSIRPLSDALMAEYPTNADTLKTILRVGTTAFLIDNSKRIAIPEAILSHYSTQSPLTTYSAGVISKAPTSITGTRYVKSQSSAQLYYLENGSRRPVNSWATFTQLGGSNSNITTLSDSGIQIFPIGTNMP